MNRRNFTKTCGKFSMASILGVTFLQSCQMIMRVPHTYSENKIAVKKADCKDMKVVIIETSKLPAPIYLNLKDADNYIALLMLCTHRQCDVVVSGNILHCPCHGSEFSNEGKVLESPATEDLKQFKVSIDNENIYIHIN